MAEICADTHAQASGPFIWQQINNRKQNWNVATARRNVTTLDFKFKTIKSNVNVLIENRTVLFDFNP